MRFIYGTANRSGSPTVLRGLCNFVFIKIILCACFMKRVCLHLYYLILNISSCFTKRPVYKSNQILKIYINIHYINYLKPSSLFKTNDVKKYA